MNTRQLRTLYKKEILDVIRDKKTIFTMVVLPLVLYPLIFLVAMQIMTMILSDQEEKTYYVAYDQVSSENQKALEDWIDGDEDGYTYVIRTRNPEEPSEALEQEKIDAYITTTVTDEQVIYEVHYLSAVTDSSNVSDILEEEITSYSEYCAKQNAEALGLQVDKVLYPVDAVLTDQSSSESSVGSLLGSFIPFLLITGIMTGCMYPAIDATAGEKERGTLETLLTLPVGNLELIISKFLSVATVSVITVFVNLLSIGGIVAYLFATVMSLSEQADAFRLSSFVPAILISVVCVIAFALFMSAVVMCICAFAKSFKEANNYITPLTLVVLLTAYVGFIPNVELDAGTALIPVANICLLLKNLLVFKYDFALILIVLLSNIIYAFIAVWFLSRIYNTEAVLFGESLSGIQLFERRKNIRKGSLPSIQEGLLVLVVVLLLMVYVGGMMSLSYPLAGVLVPQACIGLLPLLACIYIKADLRRVFCLHVPGVREMAGAVLLVIGTSACSLLVSNGLSYLLPDNSEDLNAEYLQLLDGVSFPVAVLLIALLPAICEEMMFRGYLFTAFRRKMKLPTAILLVSLLFGISHMSLIKLLPTAILGVALAYAVACSDSLVTSSTMHFLNNAFSVWVLYYGDSVPALSEDRAEPVGILIFVLLMLVCIPFGVLLLRKHKIRQ